MHPTRLFHWDDEAAMLDLIDRVAFTRLFLTTPDGPRVAHVPVLVTPARTLRFHLANTNALVPHLDGATALALTEGPNAYVSANWYVDVRGAVPTWNYLCVEAEGPVRRLDRSDLTALLDALSARLEPRVGEDWTRAKMEPPRFEAMLNAITAFELTISELRGTCKVSQNKSEAEIKGVLRGMATNGADDMADAIRAARA
ncbi:FMN-binding negative transcriptional regulator [Sphingomonas sp. SUN039]|uniref:FMN-binding negative transcriptional regulator n=1 Tax=Sphingomonas sp. SUN039 TaxID=2937787 RepID=UPI002164A577|nr:FMN-binding negative transcriptional regulator [Sphingomonas sp. SUN039]UVO55021.1 FMN-binding negative transcriptional regulator [Sphingomonas sp. SUN039]